MASTNFLAVARLESASGYEVSGSSNFKGVRYSLTLNRWDEFTKARCLYI